MTQFVVGSVGFQPDPAGMNQLLRSESGPTVRYLMTIGGRVKDNAQRRVGVSEPDPVPRSKPRKPGTLKASIVRRLLYQGGEPVVAVGVFSGEALKYVVFHHEGTPPHIITASSAPMLVFYWKKAGRVVVVRQVNHPGSKPNRFLTEALAEELRTA